MLEALLNNTFTLGLIVVFFIAFIPILIFSIIQNRHDRKTGYHPDMTYSTGRYSDRFRAQGHSNTNSQDNGADLITTAVVVSAIVQSSDDVSCDTSSSSSDSGSSCDGGGM